MPTQTTSRDTPSEAPAKVGEQIEIAGRTLQRVDMQQVAGEAYQDMQGPAANAIIGPPPEHDPDARAKVDAMMPDFLREAAEQEQQEAEQGESLEQVELIGLLSDKVVQARQEGNNELAESLKQLLGQALGETTPKRKRVKRDEHPALQKLRRNLGLQRIKPVVIEWGGSKWHFYPPPPAIDRWVAQVLEQGISTFAALKVAGALVGIDNAPLYEVFNVETTATFTPEDEATEVGIRLFEKRCDACSEILDVDAKQCEACGSLHDPFAMPLSLRLRCVDLVHNHFLEDFGPYEELQELYLLMRAEMPDRATNKEQLYPFLKLSPESSPTTVTTPSGDAPSSD